MCWTRTHGSRKSKHLKRRGISLAPLGSQECQIQQHTPRFSPPDSRTSPAFYVPQKSCSQTPSILSRIWLVRQTLCFAFPIDGTFQSSSATFVALSSSYNRHYCSIVTTSLRNRGKRRSLIEPYAVSGGLGDEEPTQQIFSTFPTDLLLSLKLHMSILCSQSPSLSQFVTQAYHQVRIRRL